MDAGAWAAAAAGTPVRSQLFATGNLSAVSGWQLVDGREVVVKTRPWDDRLPACATVQSALVRAGYPCPAVLAGPERIAGHAWSLEALMAGGEQLDPDKPTAAAAYAALLARLVQTTGELPGIGKLSPSPPWVGWDWDTDLWPDRDDPGPPLVSGVGPSWLDDTGRRVRARLRACQDPTVLGHGDFESQNIRWHGREPYAVHDWDSVVLQPEVAIAGAASAVWPAQGRPGQAATVTQTRDFLAAYQQARGLTWSVEQRQVAWAAGLWVRAFNAKKDAVDGGGPHLALLQTEVHPRRREAGLPALGDIGCL